MIPLMQLLPLLQQQAGIWGHPVTEWTVLETHISVVILTGPFAYKFKKPVKWAFVDFSSLAQRHYFCQEELRLNRRLAPDWYHAVVAITGSAEQLALNGPGPVQAYAVKMTQFPAQSRLDQILAQGLLNPSYLQDFAKVLADFHRRIAIDDKNYGAPAAIAVWVEENFTQLQARIIPAQQGLYQALLDWTEQAHIQYHALFEQRQAQGFIRECHGDLHLGNLILADGQLIAFDALEFNPALRWIDVMSEVAFLTMDLQDHGQSAEAMRFLNAYLLETGDYAGVTLLRYYQVYRALVRAKVACLQQQLASSQHYLELAWRLTQRQAPLLLIMHGLSGSGKSWLSERLAPVLGCVRLCADVERRRLYPEAAPEIRYAVTAHQQTYQQLYRQTQILLQAGYGVIVDATFLQPASRQLFCQLAAQQGIAFGILDVQTALPQLQANILARQQQGTDSSEATLAVLAQQYHQYQPLNPDEPALIIPFAQRLETDSLVMLANKIREKWIPV